MAISTITSLRNVKLLIESIWEAPINDIFDIIVSEDEVMNKKPSPEVYLLTLKKLALNPESCLAIEDSENGLILGKDAGIKTLVTPSFYSRNENFSQADFIYDSLADCSLLDNT